MLNNQWRESMTKDKQQELFKSILVPDCPEELHHQVKIQAAVEGIPLKELVKKALREYMERRKKKRK
jgi:predicted DNA binding CopG/RHH family protein